MDSIFKAAKEDNNYSTGSKLVLEVYDEYGIESIVFVYCGGR